MIAHDMTARAGAPEKASGTAYHDAAGQAAVTVPDAAFLSDAQYVRHGSDLYAADAAGRSIVIRGYFAADPAPDLVTADGARAASPEMIQSFVLPSAAGQYAQLGAPAPTAIAARHVLLREPSLGRRELSGKPAIERQVGQACIAATAAHGRALPSCSASRCRSLPTHCREQPSSSAISSWVISSM